MPSTVSTADFWRQLVASRLITETAAQNLEEKFVELKGEAQGNTVTLAQWLIAENVLSRYQAKVLLAGRAGPFVYGDYTVYDRHGEGRLQGTFRANHPGTRHRVLLYFHTGPVVQNEKLWSALVDQTAKLSKAIHPHLVRVYQLCDLGQFKFTVMDDLQGESAEERVAKGPLQPTVACRMIRQAAQGAARMLQLGQLHGAIRPGNIWIDKQGNAQLLLPPLARDPLVLPKPIDLGAADTSGELLRQADYLAPELAQPKQAPGPQTEVYALGCTLFNLLTGRLPFGGSDLKSKLAGHASETIPSLDATVPAPIAQVLAFSLAKDPTKRFRDPTQLADTLGKLLEKIDRTQLRWPPSLPMRASGTTSGPATPPKSRI
jgi:serine/threonine protein kinase